MSYDITFAQYLAVNEMIVGWNFLSDEKREKRATDCKHCKHTHEGFSVATGYYQVQLGGDVLLFIKLGVSLGLIKTVQWSARGLGEGNIKGIINTRT